MARGLDAIVLTASRCGTTVKDYGFMLRDDPHYAENAAKVSALARDIVELLADCGLPPERNAPKLRAVYQSPCSMRHGQKITDALLALLKAADFEVSEPAEAHRCCGSAETYNIMQPELAERLGDRKAENLARRNPDVVATGNVGCATQLASRLGVPGSTPSNCSTGRPAGRCPRALRPIHRQPE